MPKTLKKLRTAQIPTHLSDSRKQEGHEKVVWTAHSGPTQKARKYDRELLRIPVRLQLQGKEFSGFSHDFSPAGLKSRSEEHTSELQSRSDLVCRLLLEKKKQSQSAQSVFATIIKRHTDVHL